jgi:molybdopterin-guanine dinucleotide biosynthesis protein A
VIAAAILAGGRATRFGGRDKARLALGPARVLDRQLDALRQVADRVLIVSNQPDRYRDLGVPVAGDVVPGAGALGGIYSALLESQAPRTLVAACDLPFLTVPFLRFLAQAGLGADLAIPRRREGYEPLCVCYGQACIGPIEQRIARGHLQVIGLLDAGLTIREIGPDELAPFDPETLFLNINTPEDYVRALDKFSRENR